MKVLRKVLAAAGVVVMATQLVNAPGAAAVDYRPINNDCSAGYVTFTFDDGPDVHTTEVMNALIGLNLRGVFFVTGAKVSASPAAQQVVRDLSTSGFTVQNHTWDHASFTGESTGTQPLDEAQVRDELERGTRAIVDAGLPSPTLYRPPFGDINSFDDLLAQNMGLRLVMSWSTPTGNIIDSKDWAGATVAQIVSVVTQGRTANGYSYPAAHDGTIVAMHDGQQQSTLNTLAALQPIVDWMNVKHLCSTSDVRSDATGNVVPPPAPVAPVAGNLVNNASLESLRLGNTPASEPVCFQQGGASTANTTAVWSQTPDAHSGSVAEKVDVSSWKSTGDRKLVLSQKQSDATCLPAATPGATYQFWVNYKGTWAYQGANPTKVSIATYYKINGVWVYWQGSPLFPPTSTWNLAYFKSAPLPPGATAVSYGLAIQGVGALITDDYTMTVN